MRDKNLLLLDSAINMQQDLLYFPPHLERVTALPSETSAVERSDFQKVTGDV